MRPQSAVSHTRRRATSPRASRRSSRTGLRNLRARPRSAISASHERSGSARVPPFQEDHFRRTGKSRCEKREGVHIRTRFLRLRLCAASTTTACRKLCDEVLSTIYCTKIQSYIRLKRSFTRAPHQAGRSLHQTMNQHFFFLSIQAYHALHM